MHGMFLFKVKGEKSFNLIDLFRFLHFFRFAEQSGVDRCFAASGAAVAVIVDTVPAKFCLGQVLGAAPVNFFELALWVADIGGI